MKALSLTTINKYRKNAKHDSDIDIDVLKIRLNCLIDAVDNEHIRRSGNTVIYKFGECSLYVTNNIVTDIRWNENTLGPTSREQKRLIGLYLRNGLNKRGNKIVETKE